MAKLVILNQGMTGRSFELNSERTTVGRVEDNAFQIADPSVSSHHAEIHLRGADILIKDLNSTNGTFLNGEKISEIVLQTGQILRFGQVELKIDDGKTVPTAPAPVPAAPKKAMENTMVISRGVRLEQLEQGARPPGFDTNTAFSKKSNQANRIFLIGGIILGVVIVGFIIYLIKFAGGPSGPK